MGRFLDEAPVQYKPKGRFLDEPIQPSISKPKSEGVGISDIGPMSYGVSAAEKGFGIKDIPHVLAKGASGALFGIPEGIATRPKQFGMAGPIGTTGPEETKKYFPQPSSEGGEMIGKVAEFAGSMIPAESLLSSAVRLAPKPAFKPSNMEKARALSEELLFNIEKARKDVGGAQGALIKAKATERVNPEELKKVISNLPEALQKEIATNPELTKEVINKKILGPVGEEISTKGEEVLSPNLENLETLRALTKGKVRTNYWNPKIVQDVERTASEEGYKRFGDLMKEGRPEIAEAMKKYAEVRGAAKELYPILRTKQGMTKTKPILKAFGESAEGSKQQAIDILSKHNPEIPKIVERINKMAEGVAKEKAKAKFMNEIKEFAIKTLGLGTVGVAGLKIFD